MDSRSSRGCVSPLFAGAYEGRMTTVAKKATVSKISARASGKAGKGKAAKKPAARKSVAAKGEKTATAAKKERARAKSALTKAELRGYREMLLTKRRDLLGDMSGIQAEALRVNRQEGTGNLSNMPTHPADLGSDNYEQEFTLGLLESERALLNEIDEALARIEDGTYGICLGTGKPIGKPRLKARPWAKYCIDYARMIEKGLVRPGGQVEEEEDSDQDRDEGEE